MKEMKQQHNMVTALEEGVASRRYKLKQTFF